MKVIIELSIPQANNLNRLAQLKGFKRENPAARWTEAEVREAVRFGIAKLIEQYMGI